MLGALYLGSIIFRSDISSREKRARNPLLYIAGGSLNEIYTRGLDDNSSADSLSWMLMNAPTKLLTKNPQVVE
jgi:hypothetical protein